MRKIIPLSLTATAAAALLAGGIAYAQADSTDRTLTRSEVEEKATEHFAKMDANSDGVLDQADRAAKQKEMFDTMDADSNGAISFAEFTAAHEQMREKRGERRADADMRGMRGPGGHGKMRGHGFHRGGRGGMMAAMADADKDGTVTLAEFKAAALTRFDRADADGDGTISAEERRAARPTRGDRPEPPAPVQS